MFGVCSTAARGSFPLKILFTISSAFNETLKLIVTALIPKNGAWWTSSPLKIRSCETSFVLSLTIRIQTFIHSVDSTTVIAKKLGVLGQGRIDCDWHKLPTWSGCNKSTAFRRMTWTVKSIITKLGSRDVDLFQRSLPSESRQLTAKSKTFFVLLLLVTWIHCLSFECSTRFYETTDILVFHFLFVILSRRVKWRRPVNFRRLISAFISMIVEYVSVSFECDSEFF